MSSESVPFLEELAEPECRQLLGTVPIGRIGSSERALPTIQPVRFTVRGAEVMTMAFDGHRAPSAADGDVVVFEADSYDPGTLDGWAVTVVGRTRVIADADEIAELDQVAFASSTAVASGHVVAVRMEVVSGRRLRSAADRPAPRTAA